MTTIRVFKKKNLYHNLVSSEHRYNKRLVKLLFNKIYLFVDITFMELICNPMTRKYTSYVWSISSDKIVHTNFAM